MKITPTSDQKKMMTWLAGAGLSIASVVAGTFMVAPREGKVNGTYLDPVGIVTACYGHTGPELKLGTKYTDFECLNMLAKDLGPSELAVERQVHVPLNVYQKAALISWTYNFGETKLKGASMTAAFNRGDYATGCTKLLDWVYAGGKKLGGLVRSRNVEFGFCMGTTEVEGVKAN